MDEISRRSTANRGQNAGAFRGRRWGDLPPLPSPLPLLPPTPAIKTFDAEFSLLSLSLSLPSHCTQHEGGYYDRMEQ
ncbi:hypothetical protein CEXT_630051 [Caerostris extrusa]|uniref:Uncharacterized protein n=1 Tax=Caerostris extrusa TaxID=172846 RepID=A0AAV4RWT2_CAEEX|nr:hypothetical protein CEXT_630051 [Caerostris extrusa]